MIKTSKFRWEIVRSLDKSRLSNIVKIHRQVRELQDGREMLFVFPKLGCNPTEKE